jgi:hypothetical protein
MSHLKNLHSEADNLNEKIYQDWVLTVDARYSAIADFCNTCSGKRAMGVAI